MKTIQLKRTCTKCGESFPATKEYFWWNIQKGRFHLRCRECQRKYQKEYTKKNRDKKKGYDKEYRKRNKEKIKEYKKENEEKIKEYNKKWCEENKEHHKEYYKEYHCKNKEKRKEYNASYAPFILYATQLTIDEAPIDDGNSYMEVLCTYCGKYFHPTISAVHNRISCLLGQIEGECRLYCSQGCKDACPIFYKSVWPEGFKNASSREVDPLIRQLCLERDDYTCQKCEKTIDEIELHAHHIEGVTQMPMLSNDVDNTITLCIDCHVWVHTQEGCTYFDLRKKEC